MAPQHPRNGAHGNLPKPVADAATQNHDVDGVVATNGQDPLMLELDRLLEDSLPIGADNETTQVVEASRLEFDAVQDDLPVAVGTVNSTEYLPQQEIEDDWILVGDGTATTDQVENLVGIGSWKAD